MGDLTEHFSRWEFACRCGCGFNVVDPLFVDELERMRVQLGRPMNITSGCRCPEHNAAVGGVPNSAHIRGTAADIAVQGGSNRFEFVQLAFAFFNRIGVAKTFCHVDCDEELISPSLWSY